MKYYLLILFSLLSFIAISQVSNTKVVRIANASTVFSQPLSEGNILIDLNTDNTYLILMPIAGTNSLSTLTIDVDYKLLTVGQLQTLDVAQLNGTNLELSLSNDGEATHQIDLSSLKDGTGTDDQTASEVQITDAGDFYTSSNVEGALQEIGSSIISGGDDWGSEVVIGDATLIGNGTSGNALKVDTTIIATKNDITSGIENVEFNKVTTDTLNVQSITYSDTYWDDLQVNVSSVNLKNSYEPSWVDYKGYYVMQFENSQNDGIYFTAQLPHKYKPGSNVFFHIHLVYPDGSSANVDWTFTYSWANIGDNFPSESTINIQTASTGVSDKHTISSIATLNGTGKKESSVLLCSLTRNGSSGSDTYGNHVYLVALDFHYEINKPGSNNMIPD